MRRLFLIAVGGIILIAGAWIVRGNPSSGGSVPDALPSAQARSGSQATSAAPAASASGSAPTSIPDVATLGTSEPSPPAPAPSGVPIVTPSPVNDPAVAIEAGGTLSLTPSATATLGRGHFGASPGVATVQQVRLPAPWTGGYATSVKVVVRLPANYDPAHRRYPVVYETPNTSWSHLLAPGTPVALAERAGTLPATIFVFAAAIGGPYNVSWCIDSRDGTERWDTFMATTLVAYIDSHYATIPEAAARTIIGSSQGAYCSADLLLRHPDVWHQEISFDGLYDAPPRLARTANASRAFGGDQSLMDAYAPILIAPQIPSATRQQLFFVLLGLSSQQFYGPQMDGFATVLDQAGYARAVIETPFGHSWATVDHFILRSLSLIAARLVQQGVLH